MFNIGCGIISHIRETYTDSYKYDTDNISYSLNYSV